VQKDAKFPKKGSLNSLRQDTTNRYTSVNTNVNVFNQTQTPILGKFRAVEEANANLNKYTVQTPRSTTTPNYGTVSYTQTIDAPDIKQRLPISYTSTTATATPTTSTIHVPEITQDLTALLQQTDTKRALQNVNASSWQTLTTPASTVADYLSHLPASGLPLSLHHFLKYSESTLNIKKEANNLTVSLFFHFAKVFQSQSSAIPDYRHVAGRHGHEPQPQLADQHHQPAATAAAGPATANQPTAATTAGHADD
jgi:hypothetical protein